MSKTKAKAKPKPKTASKSGASERAIATEGLLMAEAASQIHAQDCAAYSVLMFNRGNVESDEWQEAGVEALAKFANFGWTMFHALGGLNIAWDEAQANIALKLRGGLPKRAARKGGADR